MHEIWKKLVEGNDPERSGTGPLAGCFMTLAFLGFLTLNLGAIKSDFLPVQIGVGLADAALLLSLFVSARRSE